MKRIGIFSCIMLVSCFIAMVAVAQSQPLSLDRCKELALENNKQLAIQRTSQSIAQETKRITQTMYLPKFDLTASYLHTSKEISILNDNQKATLSNLGTIFQELSPTIAAMLNGLGGKVIDAFRTDTRNMWVGAVTMTQPLYLGGRLTAANKIADLGVELTHSQLETETDKVEVSTENAYWLVISLCHKQKLAQNYHSLLQKFQSDVDKMVKEGVATKADQLNVNVKVNEAEMTLTQVNDGVVLSRMALCRLCGIPVDSNIILEDELTEDITDNGSVPIGNAASAIANRSEIKMLSTLEDIADQGVKMARADYMPTLAMTAGYMMSNPNVLNGFEKKFSGLWNVGVLLNMPLWHWNEAKYKIRAAKSTALIASMKKQDAQDLITLQVSQDQFKLNEARKKLQMTEKNIESAEENLKSANMGFKEGLFNVTTVMEAQTAWLKAKTQRLDAQIDVKLALTELTSALGN